MYCKHCGKLLKDSSNYCKFCGEKQKIINIIEKDEIKMPVAKVVIGAFVIIGVLISVHILDRRYMEQQKERIYYNNKGVGNRYQNKNITASGESQRDIYIKENRKTRKKVNSKALFPGKSQKDDNNGEGETSGDGDKGSVTGSEASDIHAGGSSTGGKGVVFSLAGRKPKLLPKPVCYYHEEGKVVVEITVDKFGRITKAKPGVIGSTTLNKTLLDAAKKAALRAKFEKKPDAPAYQNGTITYFFSR